MKNVLSIISLIIIMCGLAAFVAGFFMLAKWLGFVMLGVTLYFIGSSFGNAIGGD